MNANWEDRIGETMIRCADQKLTAVQINADDLMLLWQAYKNAERWKAEHLTVESWWAKIDAHVRKHPDTTIGCVVADRALALLKQRDQFKAQIDDIHDGIKQINAIRDRIDAERDARNAKQ